MRWIGFVAVMLVGCGGESLYEAPGDAGNSAPCPVASAPGADAAPATATTPATLSKFIDAAPGLARMMGDACPADRPRVVMAFCIVQRGEAATLNSYYTIPQDGYGEGFACVYRNDSNDALRVGYMIWCGR